MKILKQGKSKEEIDRIIKRVRQFECSICGCVFEANDTEYKYQFSQREGTEWWEVNALIVASSPINQYQRDRNYILLEVMFDVVAKSL